MDRKLVLKFMREIAREREEIHKHHKSNRPLSKDYELIGLVGEWDFHRVTGLPIDLSLRSSGDGRVDFNSKVGTIDVKTAQKAYNLLREVNKPHADILVLAQYYEDKPCEFLGWEYDSEMLNCIIRKFVPNGPRNHYKNANLLRKMEDLYKLL